MYMVGVDKFNENVDSLRVSLHGKKWWFLLFVSRIDTAMQNALQIYRVNKNKSKYWEFRKNFVHVYCILYWTKPMQGVSLGIVANRISVEIIEGYRYKRTCARKMFLTNIFGTSFTRVKTPLPNWHTSSNFTCRWHVSILLTKILIFLCFMFFIFSNVNKMPLFVFFYC